MSSDNEVIFVRGFSSTFKKKFKEFCERNDVSMTALVKALMEEALKGRKGSIIMAFERAERDGKYRKTERPGSGVDVPAKGNSSKARRGT